MSRLLPFTSPSPEFILQDKTDLSPTFKTSHRPMSTASDHVTAESNPNGDCWRTIPYRSMSPEFENEPVGTQLPWPSWSGVRRTRSLSEADQLAFAESQSTTPPFLAVEEPGSPVLQLPPPPIGAALKRSLTLPPRLHPDDHGLEELHRRRRNSSADDVGFVPCSPFVEQEEEEEESDGLVVELQRQLDERDAKMREISEEAMFSVSQLHELTAIVMEMKAELDSLKAENDRLQRLVEQDGVSPTTVPPTSASKAELRRTNKAPPGPASVGLGRPEGQEVM